MRRLDPGSLATLIAVLALLCGIAMLCSGCATTETSILLTDPPKVTSRADTLFRRTETKVTYDGKVIEICMGHKAASGNLTVLGVMMGCALGPVGCAGGGAAGFAGDLAGVILHGTETSMCSED